MTTTAQNKRAGITRMLCLTMLIVTGAIPVAAQNGTENGQWRYWGGDEGSTRYSPLDQINADNVADLEVADRSVAGSSRRWLGWRLNSSGAGR